MHPSDSETSARSDTCERACSRRRRVCSRADRRPWPSWDATAMVGGLNKSPLRTDYDSECRRSPINAASRARARARLSSLASLGSLLPSTRGSIPSSSIPPSRSFSHGHSRFFLLSPTGPTEFREPPFSIGIFYRKLHSVNAARTTRCTEFSPSVKIERGCVHASERSRA